MCLCKLECLHRTSYMQIVRDRDVNLFRRSMEQFVDSRNSDAPGSRMCVSA